MDQISDNQIRSVRIDIDEQPGGEMGNVIKVCVANKQIKEGQIVTINDIRQQSLMDKATFILRYLWKHARRG